MEWTTKVDIPTLPFCIEPHSRLLCVGSCFADAIGRQLRSNMFATIINPYGVMYNPASIYHTVMRTDCAPRVVVMTLGTNHVYRLIETGEIVDNCRKRPARLFQEEELIVEECCDYLQKAVDILVGRNSQVRVILTVSPIRYAKYGYHESQLSKATLLLAADAMVRRNDCCCYFPAYEIVNDELRDYRFYKEDMLHPSEQAVEYIWQRLSEVYLSDAAKKFLAEWEPLRKALAHRPFNADGEEYRRFVDATRQKIEELRSRYPLMPEI